MKHHCMLSYTIRSVVASRAQTIVHEMNYSRYFLRCSNHLYGNFLHTQRAAHRCAYKSISIFHSPTCSHIRTRGNKNCLLARARGSIYFFPRSPAGADNFLSPNNKQRIRVKDRAILQRARTCIYNMHRTRAGFSNGQKKGLVILRAAHNVSSSYNTQAN